MYFSIYSIYSLKLIFTQISIYSILVFTRLLLSKKYTAVLSINNSVASVSKNFFISPLNKFFTSFKIFKNICECVQAYFFDRVQCNKRVSHEN